ncbi:hypothetical protein D3C73_1663760 [compost metagenome]
MLGEIAGGMLVKPVAKLWIGGMSEAVRVRGKDADDGFMNAYPVYFRQNRL